MRLFIAINFDEDTKDRLCRAQERLREYTTGGNYTQRENMHLTLAFIGETPPDRARELSRAMGETAMPELTLTFDHAGRFGRSGGDVWWIGLAENPELGGVRRALLGRLVEHGFRFDAGRFTPHVTLARGVRTPGGMDAARILPEPFFAGADKLSLMLSERVGGVLRYSELY